MESQTNRLLEISYLPASSWDSSEHRSTERVKGKRVSMKNENEERDAARAVIEEAISLANEAGVFCSACVGKIEAGRRPVDFCSTCHSVLMLWLQSIVERETAAMAAKYPGRFAITYEGGKTFVKRNW